MKKRGFIHEMNKHWALYLMCVPALILLLMFSYIPLAGIYMAFTDFSPVDGIFGSEFVGFKNFEYFFNGNVTARRVVFNTLYINAWNLVLGLIVPVAIAIFFNEIRSRSFKKLTQSAMFFPYFLSWVVIGSLVYAFLATDVGIINNWLTALGFENIRFFSSPQYWRAIIIFANLFKWSGYNSVIYLAAMMSFDSEMYEAAEIDGANKFQKIRYVTLPLLKPTAVVLTLMSIGRIFYGDRARTIGIVGNNPIILPQVQDIDTYVYSAMQTLGFSYTTAIGLFQSVMGLITIVIANWLAKKINDGEGLF